MSDLDQIEPCQHASLISQHPKKIEPVLAQFEVIRHHQDDVGTTRGRHFARFSTLTRRRKKQYEAEFGSQEDACGVKKNAPD